MVHPCARRAHALVRGWLPLSLAALALLAALPDPAFAQGRGGGGPGGGLGGGGGPPAFPMMRGMGPDVAHGRPVWAGEQGVEASRKGQETALEAHAARLSKGEAEKALTMAREQPQFFEVDDHGALILKGEIVAVDPDPAALARAAKAGFAIRRQAPVEGTGIAPAILSSDKDDARHAIRWLRRHDPAGRYDFNHVYFQSGGAAKAPAAGGGPVAPSHHALLLGLVDTGVTASALHLDGRALIARSFPGGVPVAASHGTAVAALLTRGLTERTASLYAADIYSEGVRGGSAELLARALGWLAANHVPVINVSLVGPPNQLVAAVVRALIAKGHIIVAPVGNDGVDARPLYPASYPGVVAVSAVDSKQRLLPEASRVKRVDFVAQGIVEVPDLAGRKVTARGTSFAAPIVSRRLAAMMGGPSPAQAQAAIRKLRAEAVPLRGSGRNGFGHGFIADRP